MTMRTAPRTSCSCRHHQGVTTTLRPTWKRMDHNQLVDASSMPIVPYRQPVPFACRPMKWTTRCRGHPMNHVVTPFIAIALFHGWSRSKSPSVPFVGKTFVRWRKATVCRSNSRFAWHRPFDFPIPLQRRSIQWTVEAACMPCDHRKRVQIPSEATHRSLSGRLYRQQH